MIAFLEGSIQNRTTDAVVVSVQGVGYYVHLTPTTIAALPSDGTRIQFHIHTHVREDQISLFGFLQRSELQLFQRLLNVQGIGPKLALTVLAGLEPAAFVSAVINDDLVRLNAIPGIGKKTAERIVLDLKDRLIKDGLLTTLPLAGQALSDHGLQHDAISALVNLGYQRPHAEKIIGQLLRQGQQPLNQLIKSALKELAQT